MASRSHSSASKSAGFPARRGRLLGGALAAVGVVPVLMSASIVGVLIAGIFGPTAGAGPGLGALIVGSALVCAMAMLVAVPVGLLAAIHLTEFASARARRVLEPSFELLAGLPSVVLAYLGLQLLAPSFQAGNPALAEHSGMVAGLTLALMVTPCIALGSARSLQAVPRGLREGAWALGGGQVQTILTIVLPNAASGVVAAILLGLSRAVGDMVIVAVLAGQVGATSLDPRAAVETLAGFIAHTSETGETRELFIVAAALFGLSAFINLGARRLMLSHKGRGGLR